MAGTAALSRARANPEALVTAAALPLSLVIGLPRGAWTGSATAGVVLSVLAWLPLLVRFRWPLLVTVAAAVFDTARIGVVGHEHGGAGTVPVAAMLALYTVSLRESARIAWFVATATAAVQLVVASLVLPSHGTVLLYLNWPLVSTALGRLVRERHERIAAAEQRALDAERGQEAEARRQVMAERMRIARDLHDVLAHRIAGVNAQANVAQYLLRSNPDAAEQALAGITNNTKAALDDMRTTLGLLRSDGDANPGEELEPSPGADQLGALVADFVAVGTSVSLATTGSPTELPAPADLAVYRIAQEALTNATKHAPGSSVTVTVVWSHATVVLTVVNSASPRGRQSRANAEEVGTGHGLLGMRERAASANGVVTAVATPAGGFRVRAEIPLGDDHSEEAVDVVSASRRTVLES